MYKAMYARLALFTLGPGMHSTAERLADEMIPKFRARKEFKSVAFLEDDESGEYGGLFYRNQRRVL